MEKLNLIYCGNPILAKPSEEITVIDNEIKELALEMHKTMRKEGGIGLAAPQIGINKRLCVIECPENKKSYTLTLINPQIKSFFGEKVPFEEGCLSVPGITARVIRPSGIILNALDINGENITINTDGLLARVIQHEIDHLDGILFTEQLEKEEYFIVERRLKKLIKKTKKELNILTGRKAN